MRTWLLALSLLVALSTVSRAQNQQCRTAPVGTSTSNCASEAFVTQSVAAGPWTAWAPAVVPQTGAFASVSAAGGYNVIGKLVHFTVTITITTVGTATGSMSIALPLGTANRNAVAVVSESASTGNMGFGRILAGGTTIAVILKYDNSSYIGANNVVTLNGFYEQT